MPDIQQGQGTEHGQRYHGQLEGVEHGRPARQMALDGRHEGIDASHKTVNSWNEVRRHRLTLGHLKHLLAQLFPVAANGLNALARVMVPRLLNRA